MNKFKNEAIHIFYNENHPHGYTTASNNKKACEIARELTHRTGVPVSVYGGDKNWQGKYSNWIIEITTPFREQVRGGYVVQTVLT